MTLLDRATTTISDVMRSIPGVADYIRRAQQETAAANHAERLQIASEIKRIEAAELDALRQHERMIAPVAASIAQLEKQLTSRRNEFARLELDRRAVNCAASQQLDRLRGRLECLAPSEAIAACAADLFQELEALHLRADHIKTLGMDGRYHVRWSNRDSLMDRSKAISAAIVAVRALANEALDATAIQARCEALRATFPRLQERPADAHLL
jgi:hypothetical protein